MLPSEIIKEIRRIEIKTGRLVTETMAGEYRSTFKGRGMEFDEVREYIPGDDVRTIDWNVTARTGAPFIKRYIEERELTVVIACDISGSQGFGTRGKLKRETAAELSALLAFSAIKNKDKVGLLLFTDEVELFVPARKGKRHTLRLIRDILTHKPRRTRTNIAAALDKLNRIQRKRGIVFLISDFLDPHFEQAVRRTSKKHDLICAIIEDPAEENMPAVGAYINLEDPETGKRIFIHPNRRGFSLQFSQAQTRRRQDLEAFFKKTGVDHFRIRNGESYTEPLVRFFEDRSRRRR